MTGTVSNWTDANQRFLAAHLARVRGYVEHRAGETTMPEWDDALAPPALVQVQTAFRLSDFERDVVLLCAGLDLDTLLADACRAAPDAAPRVTFGMALAVLPGAHWSALSPGAPLRYWRFVHIETSASVANAALRIDERTLHFLAGVQHLDEQLEGFVAPVATSGALSASHAQVSDAIARAWQQAEGTGVLPAVTLAGADRAAKPAIAARVCENLGMRLFRLDADALPAAPDAFDVLHRLWTREAVLSRAALLVEAEDVDDPTVLRRITRFVDTVGSPVCVARSQAQASGYRPTLTFTADRPPRPEQKRTWESLLGETGARLNGHLDKVTAQFSLGLPAIQAATLQVQAAADHGRDLPDALWEACRAQSRHNLSGLAQRIEPKATWDSLVLPDLQSQLLRDLVVHVQQQITVYETWGFARTSSRGLGIAALFAGPSGTGKTLAAEVVAHSLRLDLLHVDLSRVVSKYIGETEKNLGRVFDEAERGGAVLLFDEADALFGKRSEVKDSLDRYANLEVSYLLQRIEAFRGLAILTTNLKKALDDAFQRRLRFVVPFPYPDANARADLWRKTIPAEAPTENLDTEKLARLNASGGTIRTIALHAAFLAADAGTPLTMPHLLAATRRVYAKLEQPLTEGEIRGWA